MTDTWLDHKLVQDEAADVGQVGFGREVGDALDRRRTYLIHEGLARSEAGQVVYQRDMRQVLRQRELRRAATTLSGELGKAFAPAEPGDPIEGVYRRPVKLASGKFALIEKSQEFTLVPWRDVLERHRDKKVLGLMRGMTVSWSFQGRRGLGLG